MAMLVWTNLASHAAEVGALEFGIKVLLEQRFHLGIVRQARLKHVE